MNRKYFEEILFLFLPKYFLVKKIFVTSKTVVKSEKMRLPSKIAIGAGVTLFVVIIFGWIGFPKLLTSKIKSVS